MSNNTGVVGLGDLKDQLKIVNVLVPVAVSASAGTLGVDRQGFNTVLFATNSGAVVSSGASTQKVQHSDTDVDGNYVDVAAGDVQWGDIVGAAITASGTLRQVSVDCRRLSRYVRLYNTITGTSIVLGTVAVLGAADSLPTV